MNWRAVRPRRTSRRGIALLITMIVVVLYAILSYHYIYLATSYSRIVANDRDEKVAYWVARGGLYRARAHIKLDSDFTFDSLNEDWARPVQNESATPARYDVDGNQVEAPGNVPSGVEHELTVSDEEGKWNILLLMYETQDEKTLQQIKDIFERLIDILRRQDERLREIPDWDSPRLDPDDPTPNQIHDGILRYLKAKETDDGDEASFAADAKTRGSIRKQSPYTLLTIKELLYAERMTPKVLLGYDPALVNPENPTEKISREEQLERQEEERRKFRGEGEYDVLTGEQLSESDRRLQDADAARIGAADDRSYSRYPLPLSDFITIWGDGRININTAPREVLLALSEHFTWQMVEDIIVARDAAKAREQAVADENVADPVDPNDAAPATDPNTGQPVPGTDEQDNRSFRAADIASVLAFYNRVYTNLTDEQGEPMDPIQSADQIPEEWVKAFEDMQPFLTVRSRYFRVRSSAKVDKIRRTFEAVFRRDQGVTAPGTTNNANTGNNTGGNTTGGNTTGGNTTGGNTTTTTTGSTSDGTRREGDPVIPDEPPVRLTLIYINEVD